MRLKLEANRKIKLSTLLTGLVATSVLCTALILLLTSYTAEKQSLLNTTLTLNYSKASKMSLTVDSLFKSMRASLRSTAQFLEDNVSTDYSEVQSHLEIVNDMNRYFNSILWIDESGVIRNIAPDSIGIQGQTFTEKILKEDMEAKKSFVSSPYIGPTGRLIIVIGEPYFTKDGAFRGYIVGTIYLREENILNEIIGAHGTDELNSYYFVVDREGHLIYHPDKARLGEDVTPNPFVRKLISGQSGKGIVINTRGKEFAAAYSYITEPGWGIIQQTPTSSIKERLKDSVQKQIVYMLPPFLLLLLLSMWLAQLLVRPFVSLANIVNDFSEGKTISLPSLKSHWNREADFLNQTVTLAIQTIQMNNNKLAHRAVTDPLTGLSNRRALTELMEDMAVEGKPYSLIVIDIDKFKGINDTYGHQAGDEVLKHLAGAISNSVRDGDSCFRYGGEEFVILLPNTYEEDAFKMAEILRESTENTISPVGQAITISLGIAVYPTHSKSPDELFRMADKALYQSKNDGRNRTTIAKS
ncbi:GGDEF domain-containing protein [Paenibacillus sp. GSMTC-2017]|uniref:sensor domain-containing diguanylate cyclase n=1 Tax=Paenibacillus sp. GSMTC-2017 TaxID=2794350 RepID=UPI0018D6D37B|nr:sensor domain-containing diguanylate cyclase [Paenibacillus sp. GSMTC-2017]MBH5319809.1 GGDEF domain-containing protein [Paenibacillus sp. GSMTC-2017]